MGLLVRRIVLGLVGAAIAAQGLVAVSTGIRALQHRVSGSTAPMRLDLSDTPVAQRAPVPDARRTRPSTEPAAQARSSNTRVAAPKKVLQAKKSKNGAGTSVQFNWALLHRELLVPAPDPVAGVVDTLVPAVAPFVTDGPDRPPRHA